MDKSEIRGLLEKLMAAFADDEAEETAAEETAEEAAEELTEEAEEAPEEETAEEEAATDAAEEVSEELTEDSDESPEEAAEEQEEDAEDERHEALTDEMKALIRTEVARLFKEMAKGGERREQEADDETSAKLNKVTGIYGPNND